MEKKEKDKESIPVNFTRLDYTLDQEHLRKQSSLGESSCNNNNGLVNYMLNNNVQDFHIKISEDENDIDGPVYLMKFGERFRATMGDEETWVSDSVSVQPRFLGEDLVRNVHLPEVKNKRKRPRSMKTSEEVESQRMTHIAVERNRRKQMNEHLKVLRSLMPGSYVQRGDQASIIGGAIEFVRELEQLLQCLESQKHRRLFGDDPRQIAGDSSLATQHPQFLPPNEPMKVSDIDNGFREETAESKSCLADIEVKLFGFDAMIKILSRRRPGQLRKAIAAFEDLQLNILRTNITTIEHTVLYTFNVKILGESRISAEDIASSVQQIFTFIHTNSSM